FCADCFSITSNNDRNALIKYIYYFLKTKQEDIYKLRKGGGQKHVYPNDLADILIPLPPLEIQNEIVKILDQFNDLSNSISQGIPKEIELRQKQYEYYRNKLLTFKEI
ncbi:restriction endonuclease subunit S, partial [bacterium]|nr:restriction endonuclease subunit S [bacterium]